MTGSDVWLTSLDPEPPFFTTVETGWGTRWTRHLDPWPCFWLQDDLEGLGDPESWTKVAGNYGPVRVIVWGTHEDWPW